MARRERETPETCPNCGADVPVGALACPECGADEETGWNETAVEQRLGIEDTEGFDHEAWEREESGQRPSRPFAGLWWITALILLAVTLIGFVFVFLGR
jgi:hypothetical protein